MFKSRPNKLNKLGVKFENDSREKLALNDLVMLEDLRDQLANHWTGDLTEFLGQFRRRTE